MAFDTDQAERRSGEIAAEISNGIVRLIKAHGDRGPTECRTHIDEDLVIVVMRGGYSRLEKTLFDDGKFLDVRKARHVFQDTMEGRFTEEIERVTGREVAAFMSASHQSPDVQMEIFMLDGSRPTQAGSGDPAR
jgi:uncharacterized protein YbcI